MRPQRTVTKERSGMEVCHGRIVISVGVISGTPPRSPSTTSNACTFLLERKRSPAGAAGGNAFRGRQERPSGWGHRSASRGPVPFRTRLALDPFVLGPSSPPGGEGDVAREFSHRRVLLADGRIWHRLGNERKPEPTYCVSQAGEGPASSSTSDSSSVSIL